MDKDKLLDISNMKEIVNEYGGSEAKTTFLINDEKYMIKFPDPVREKNNELSYMNNCYSEYIGSHIFELVGLPVQETLLVTCIRNGKRKIAVACRDFLDTNEKLIEAKKLYLPLKEDSQKSVSIENVYEVFNSLSSNDDELNKFKDRFWDVFVVDTLIGNTDRHLGNFGFVIKDNKYEMSPTYDCGSSLNPLLSESDMERLLEDSAAFKSEVYNIHSVYNLNSERILYPKIYANPPLELKAAVKRIVPRINMDDISNLIDEIPSLSKVQKEFYKRAILLRKEEILDKAYNKILKEESK